MLLLLRIMMDPSSFCRHVKPGAIPVGLTRPPVPGGVVTSIPGGAIKYPTVGIPGAQSVATVTLSKPLQVKPKKKTRFPTFFFIITLPRMAPIFFSSKNHILTPFFLFTSGGLDQQSSSLYLQARDHNFPAGWTPAPNHPPAPNPGRRASTNGPEDDHE